VPVNGGDKRREVPANLFYSDFNFALYTRFYSFSQASAGSEFIEQQGPQLKSDEPDHD